MAKSRSKYAGVVDKLPALPAAELERQDVVQQVKQEILEHPPLDVHVGDEMIDVETSMERVITGLKSITLRHISAASFAAAYVQCRHVKEQLDTFTSSIGLLLEAYQQLMLEQMENEDITALRLVSGQLVSTWKEPYARVVDREAFRQWCDADPDLRLKLQLHASTTTMITKERLLQGEPEPPGVTAYAMPKVRLGGE